MFINIDKKNQSDLERITTLRILGNCIGSNWLVAGLIISAKAIQTKSQLDAALAIMVLLSSFILIVLGWLSGAEQIRYLNVMYQKISDNKERFE